MRATSDLPHAWQRAIVIFIVVVALGIFLVPVWLTLVWASWHDSQIFSFPPHFFFGHLWSNLSQLNAAAQIWRALLNSVIIGVLTAFGAVLLCTCAGYAFAKFRFKFKTTIFYLLLATAIIPSQITAVPLFIIMDRLGWINTYQAVIIPAIAPALGLSICAPRYLRSSPRKCSRPPGWTAPASSGSWGVWSSRLSYRAPLRWASCFLASAGATCSGLSLSCGPMPCPPSPSPWPG